MLTLRSSVASRALNVPCAFVLALGLAGALHLPMAQADVAVPGQSVGKIRLGDSRAIVLRRLGKPSTSARWKTGPTQDSWVGAKIPDEYGGESFRHIELNVIYVNGKVVQIEFNSPSFKTAQGISIGNSLQQFRRAYKGVKPTAYAYTEGGGGYVGYYFDSRAKGIAFSFGTQDYFDARVKPELLRIHRIGYPVLADPGGKVTPATDELAIGAQPR